MAGGDVGDTQYAVIPDLTGGGDMHTDAVGMIGRAAKHLEHVDHRLRHILIGHEDIDLGLLIVPVDKVDIMVQTVDMVAVAVGGEDRLDVHRRFAVAQSAIDDRCTGIDQIGGLADLYHQRRAIAIRRGDTVAASQKCQFHYHVLRSQLGGASPPFWIIPVTRVASHSPCV